MIKPRTSNGMSVIASTRDEKVETMPPSTDEICIVPKGRLKALYGCGHIGHQRYAHNFFGQVYDLNPNVLRRRSLCGECLLAKSMSCVARCVLCGHAIFPGEGVSVYRDEPEYADRPWRIILPAKSEPADTIIERFKQLVGIVPNRVMGCLRMACCPSGGFFAGHWDGVKFVSAFSRGTAAEQALKSGGIVIVGDTTTTSSSTDT